MLIGKPLSPFQSIQLRKPQDVGSLEAYLNKMKSKEVKLVVVVVPDAKGYYSKLYLLLSYIYY